MVEQSDPNQQANEATVASSARTPGWWVKTVNDPVRVSLAVVGFAFAFGAWYVPSHLTNRLDKQSADIDGLKAQLAQFDKKITEKLTEEFSTLRGTLDQQIDRVETKFENELSSAEEVISRDINEARTAAESVVDRVDTAERKVASIETLIKLGISHTMVQDAVLSVIENNREVLGTPEQVSELWGLKGELSAGEFEEYLLANYQKLNAKVAMLMSYDELTENKPVEYFIDLQEIRASTEPELGAALEALEQSLAAGAHSGAIAESEVAKNVELLQVDALTIVRICDELTGIADTECYKYFLSGDHQANSDGLMDLNANKAVVRAIASKYQKLIPDS